MNENKIKLKYLCESFNSAIIASTLKTRGKTAVYGASGLSGYSDNGGISKEYLGIVKDGAGVGRIAQYKAGTLLVGTMSYIFPKKDCDINWLKYCIASLNLADSIDKATIPHIYFSDYGNRSVLNLSREEQKKTANFLEGKTSLVDQLISNQEKQVERLKEYRQAIITKAVTKGLDPSVQMKDSGVESIGRVPFSWSVLKTKYVFDKLLKGSGITKQDIYDDGDIQCVRYGEIYSKYDISFRESYSRTIEKKIPSKVYLNYGDIVFSGTGELIEEIGKNIVYLGTEKCLAGGDIIVGKHHSNPSFLNYALYCSSSQIQKSKGKAKLKVVHISPTEIGNIFIAIPPLEEQAKIALYLDEKLSTINKLIELKQLKIVDLKNYKQSLIYEYVTGKKRVSL